MGSFREIHRRGFGRKKEVAALVADEFGSALITYLQSHDYALSVGELQIYLAREFGFCYGVERAIDYAFQTRRQFPDRRIYLIGEIVHNPFVNRQMRAMGIEILDGQKQEEMDFSFLTPEDVVVFPAFGVKHATVQRLRERGCVLVDTTCGSVIAVWKRVEKYAREGYTTVLHGKFQHEETQAILSQVAKFPGAKYVVVRDRDEARLICEVISGERSASDLLEKLGAHASPDFDPARDLQRLGFANQTTMLRGESLQIAEMLREAMRRRFGEAELQQRILSFDTICSATQDRQDAVLELIAQKQPHLMLIVGGFQSSNTGHLAEIAAEHLPAYHIEDAECLLSAREIKYRDPRTKRVQVAEDWLPEGRVKIGLTAGASTPNRKLGEVILRLFALKQIEPDALRELLDRQ